MIETFVWSARFDTGIESVDLQHRHLVELVNQVGSHLAENTAFDVTQQDQVFRQLTDYARQHFSNEQHLMHEAGIDPGHLETHIRHHREFVDQLVAMWRARTTMARPAEMLHGFLASWLTYHILGEDQQMAREMQRIRSGMAPAEAHRVELDQHDPSAAALLKAMDTIYGVLGERNRALDAMNQELETRVVERTEALTLANSKLEREQAELTVLLSRVEQVQGQLLQSEKMSAIGQLAAGVAHEINNPIGFVGSNLGTLGRYLKDLMRLIDAGSGHPPADKVSKEIDLAYLREDIDSLLLESQDGIERVRKIVANLKDFSHIDEAEFCEADLLAGLESTVQVVWHELKYKVELKRELAPLPDVRCIQAQINQVLMNLLVNAAQAIPEHGTITLRSAAVDDEVWIEVEDTGQGMSAEVKKRMFEPFYTTKPVGKGTGLGMSLSYDIITKHGGRFEVDSTPGVGTRIRFWLPVRGVGNGGA